jgi:hypothetical protein
MSEPIVLLLLRVPVQLINIVTTVAGTLFYAPSYLMFLLIQVLIMAKIASCIWRLQRHLASICSFMASQVLGLGYIFYSLPRSVCLFSYVYIATYR